MDFDIIRSRIEEFIDRTVEEYQGRDDVTTKFGKAKLGFVSASDQMFDAFFARGENDHPKKIWRPGNTLIVYYLPFADEIPQADEKGNANPDWLKAIEDSRWLSMKVNDAIVDALREFGRLYSRLSTTVDWDYSKHRYEWSHKLAGYLAGLGTFGPAGSFQTDTGFGGRVGAMITDGYLAPFPDMRKGDELEKEFDEIMAACRYKGAGGAACSDEMIAACPGGAISEDGIDRGKCQDYCDTLRKGDPCPDVCGRCFGFK